MNFSFHSEVVIRLPNVSVEGELIIPEGAKGIIIFSHGSGSSRFSQRNRKVAEYLHNRNYGTLLVDLLTRKEDMLYTNRFNITLLTERLIDITRWLEKQSPSKDRPLGYFGASTGAASALRAAASLPQISAVVSRGGRPDLAADALQKVNAPSLLIVGSLDHDVLELNKDAYKQMRCKKKLEVVEGATHLFEEPGTMDKVCELAAAWFQEYLQPINILN